MKKITLYIILLYILLLLVGCGGRNTPTLPISSLPSGGFCIQGTPVFCDESTPTPVETSTITATLTVTPTLTPIPPTITQTPSATVTPTTVVGGCIYPNEWRAPADEPCRHYHNGINPRDQMVLNAFNIDGFNLEAQFLQYGNLWQEPWLPIPENPRGYSFTYYHDEECTQIGGNFDFSTYSCITDILIRQHDVGTLSHELTRSHSEAFIVKGCEKGSNGLPTNVCGIAMIPFRMTDYGHFDTPYKTKICHLENEPQGYPDSLIGQPPYRTASTRLGGQGENIQYWVATTPNAIVKSYYPEQPNGLITNFAWTAVDAWQLHPGADVCGANKPLNDIKVILDAVPPLDGMTHTIFQLVDFRMDAPPTTGTVWYDLLGHENPACVQVGTNCVPYFFTPKFPGRVALSYDAMFRGDCEKIPCFTAETFGVEMLFPAYDVP